MKIAERGRVARRSQELIKGHFDIVILHVFFMISVRSPLVSKLVLKDMHALVREQNKTWDQPIDSYFQCA